MTEREKIEHLQREIKRAQDLIKNCKHSFKKPIYDPETVKKGYGSVQDGRGSDPHWSYEGYSDKKVDRWSRECAICGFKEYTGKQEAVISSYKPKFGNS